MYNKKLAEKIIEYIKSNGPSTPEDISEDLDLQLDSVKNTVHWLQEEDKVMLKNTRNVDSEKEIELY